MNIISKLCLWLVAGILCLGAVGCKNTPTHPESIAYLTLADIHNAVDKAMNLYGGLVRAEKVSAADQDKIDSLHAKYQAAMLVAIKAARQDWSAPAPDNLLDLKTELLNLIYAL